MKTTRLLHSFRNILEQDLGLRWGRNWVRGLVARSYASKDTGRQQFHGRTTNKQTRKINKTLCMKSDILETKLVDPV